MSEHAEVLIGCDFGAPLSAGAQSKKTIVIEASRKGGRRYEIAATGRNKRLVASFGRTLRWPDNRRGWTIPALAESIRTDPTVSVAAFDFPFSIPLDLLQSEMFASKVVADVFQTRANWARFVNEHVGMVFSTHTADARLRVDASLCGWKDKAFWARRATDIATNAQPPLKHMFQNLFNMTIVGSSFLGMLCEGGMDIVIHPQEAEGTPASAKMGESSEGGVRRKRNGSVIETYPGAVARLVGFQGNYKQDPNGAMEKAEAYLRTQGIMLDFDSGVRTFCLEYRTPPNDPDGADAFLCLVTAVCFRERLVAWHTGSGLAPQLNEEGCIATPIKLQGCCVDQSKE